MIPLRLHLLCRLWPILLLVAVSCISHDKTRYLRPISGSTPTQYEVGNYERLIREGDILDIQLNSLTQDKLNPFAALPLTNEATLNGYPVLEGLVQVPPIGAVKAVGLSIRQLADSLAAMAKVYVQQPTVKVRFMAFNVSILGEVSKPGRYRFYTPSVNIFELLAEAGDLLITADRTQVYILRKENGKMLRIKTDLSTDGVMNSPVFFLHPDDIVYVEPQRARTFVFNRNSVMVLSGILSTLGLVFSLINVFNQ
jgi:polysaccharide export outer membrane protein